jgi:hypothetical protein
MVILCSLETRDTGTYVHVYIQMLQAKLYVHVCVQITLTQKPQHVYGYTCTNDTNGTIQALSYVQYNSLVQRRNTSAFSVSGTVPPRQRGLSSAQFTKGYTQNCTRTTYALGTTRFVFTASKGFLFLATS